MSKTDILQELPKLGSEERREIFERICELEEDELLKGGEPTAGEKALLDRELEDYQQTRTSGSPGTKLKPAFANRHRREIGRYSPPTRRNRLASGLPMVRSATPRLR